MNRPPAPYWESSFQIHQRYEDTALVIFQQIQKKKESRFSPFSKIPSTSNHINFGHYGNTGVVAKKEAAKQVNVTVTDKERTTSQICSIS